MLRNPVIDISTMFKVTDIPDWSIIEAIGYTENDIHGTNRHYEAGDRGDSVQLRQKLYVLIMPLVDSMKHNVRNVISVVGMNAPQSPKLKL